MAVDRDPVTGRRTTGHEWDGLKELDTPVPRVAVWALRLAILFALGYWLLYPAWPIAQDYTRGLLGYSSREVVTEKVQTAAEEIAAFKAPLLEGDLSELAASAEARAAYQPAAAVLFRDNCAMCHRENGMGQRGFPNLVDDHWLWSGEAEEVYVTLLHGINYPHDDDTRAAEMLAFGRMGLLNRAEIGEVIEYVRQIGGLEHDAAVAETGAAIFEENCAACHGDGGVGGLENGAPSLVDEAWIYGAERDTLMTTIYDGRAGVMPGWRDRLTDAEIRQLALYVTWLDDIAAEEAARKAAEAGGEG